MIENKTKFNVSVPENMFLTKCAQEIVSKRKETPSKAATLEKMSMKNGLKASIFKTNGDEYIGEWKDNLKNGMGAYRTKDRARLYEGYWKDGLKECYGVEAILGPENKYELKYDGMWKRGKHHGFGTLHSKGNLYEGNWENGVMSGFGKYWFANGDYYEGDFANNKRHGRGIIVYKNGNRYEGEWARGMKNGEGVLYHLDKGRAQVGVWVDDMCRSGYFYDMDYKQSAVDPTYYPIARIELRGYDSLLEEWKNGLYTTINRDPDPPRRQTLIQKEETLPCKIFHPTCSKRRKEFHFSNCCICP